MAGAINVKKGFGGPGHIQMGCIGGFDNAGDWSLHDSTVLQTPFCPIGNIDCSFTTHPGRSGLQ